jgi:GNAT superfamily N-acetyltransferase
MDNIQQTNGQDAVGALVQQVPFSEIKSLRGFVGLERKLVGSNPLYIPEISKDMCKRLAGHSPFYSDMQHALFVVSDGKSDKARCAALINRRYQKVKDESVGFIGHFCAVPEAETQVRALLEQAEAWLQERNVDRVIAPYNGSVFLGMGLLTAAFDEEPMFPFGWHPPYYQPYLQNSGYHATYPLWFYTVDFSSEKYRAVAQGVLENKSVNVRPIDKKNWDTDLETYRNVLNESFREEWEFHPFTSEEFQAFFGAMKPVLDPRLMLMAEVDGKSAGVCWGLPDWNQMFRSFNGKFGPLQVIRLMFGAGRYHRAGLVLIGVLQDYRGTGVAQALAITLYKTYQEKGLKEAAYMCVNESNLRSRRFAESMGGTGRVLYHCYDKSLP